jgi:hypothetical protein
MSRAIAFSLLFLVPVAAGAETVCVNPGGTGGCFASLQAAIDGTPVRILEIDIAAGTYPESVLVDGDQPRVLVLRGAGTDQTFLEGGVNSYALAVLGRKRLDASDLAVRNAGADPVIGFGVPQFAVYLDRPTIGRFSRVRIAENPHAGIAVLGRVFVDDSTLEENGCAFQLSAGKLSVSRSTLRANGVSSTCFGSGSAIQASLNRGKIEITDSTITENGGSVIELGGNSGDNRGRIERTTISHNVGDLVFEIGGVLNLRSTIVAANGGILCDLQTGPTNDIGRILSKGDNLFDFAPSDCEIDGRTSFDLFETDPLLGALQDNGGATLTRLPGGGSPALGAVDDRRGCMSPDQRGVARSQPCDIGAVEVP